MADRRITLFHFNDVYNIEPGNIEPLGGAARLATGLNSIKHEQPLVLFSGDCLNPSMISAVERGSQMIPVLNGLQVDCAVLGNHEFDFGLEVLENFMKKCDFPWLLSNVIDRCTNQPLANAQVTHIIHKQGIKVGFIGLVEEDWLVTLPTLDLSDMIFLNYIERGRELANQLKQQGCDIVIALTHMAMKHDLILAENVAEIDMVLGGHDHHYEIQIVNCTYVVKSGSDFQNASIITLNFASNGTAFDTHIEKLTFDSMTEEDPTIKSIVDGYLDNFEEMSQLVLGYSDSELDGLFQHVRTRETNLGNLVADIMITSTHSDVAIVNSGTFRSNCLHPKGAFTSKDLIRILPLFDLLCVLEVTGEELHVALENGVCRYPNLDGRFPQISGMKFKFNPANKPGHRINPTNITVNGERLNKEKKYRLCCKEYLARGRDGYSVFSQCPMLVTPKDGVVLSTCIRNFYEGIVRPCSQICARNCNGLVEQPSTSHHAKLDHNLRCIPKIEGRITMSGSSKTHVSSDTQSLTLVLSHED